jgi:hypothetical protein
MRLLCRRFKQRVGRVGDLLELGQHEPRHSELRTKKPRLRHVAYPPIDDHAGVQEDAAGRHARIALGAAKQIHVDGRIASDYRDSEVAEGECHDQGHVKTPWGRQEVQRDRHERREQQRDRQADGATHQVRWGDLTELLVDRVEGSQQSRCEDVPDRETDHGEGDRDQQSLGRQQLTEQVDLALVQEVQQTTVEAGTNDAAGAVPHSRHGDGAEESEHGVQAARHGTSRSRTVGDGSGLRSLDRRLATRAQPGAGGSSPEYGKATKRGGRYGVIRAEYKELR